MPKRSLVIAIFHASIKVFKRSVGHSAVAAAAYRSGTCLRCDLTGTVHDYRKRAGVVAVEVITPRHAPAWASDPERLFNAAEASDRRINSRLARELEIALPPELDPGQRTALARDVSQMLVDTYGVAVMMAVHAPDARGDQRNHHCHLLFTTRVMGTEGFTAKVRQLDDQKSGPLEVDAIRARVAAITNEHLSRAGRPERIDHRKLAVQARAAERRGDLVAAALLLRAPTKHEGKAATAMRRRGEQSERVSSNAGVRSTNRQTLSEFLSSANAGARQIEAPGHASTGQARADGVRQSATETNERPTRSARTTTASKRERRLLSGTRNLRQKLGAPGGRGTRAEGRDGDLLNAQSAHASETRRTERDVAQRYLDMLQALIDEHGQRVADAVAYARLWDWPIADARVLAEHRVRDPRCGALLAQGIDAAAKRTRAQALGARRRERHGAVMVATAQERRSLDQVDQDNQPPVWKPRSRRAWAELRRQQRARLDQAQRREGRAQALVTDQAMAHYAVKVRTAKDTLGQIERKRATRYPVPGDARRLAAIASPMRPPLPVPLAQSPSWNPPVASPPGDAVRRVSPSRAPRP